MKKRIIMGITGASGAPLAVELLRKIRTIPDAESHVICSRFFPYISPTFIIFAIT